MNYKTILAKSMKSAKEPVYEETLAGHTSQVCDMADQLCVLTASSLQKLTECNDEDISYWQDAVWTASWLHDWGKANDHFQDMLWKRANHQGIRHETLSLVLIKEFEDWLCNIWKDWPRWAKASLFFASAGHHLKFPDPKENQRTGTEVTAITGHPHFREVMLIGSRKFTLNELPPLKNKKYSLGRYGKNSVKKIISSLKREIISDFNNKEKILIASVKSAVMAADLAGSALHLKIDNPKEWLRNKLGSNLNEKQLKKVVETRLHGNIPRAFQLEIKDAKAKTLLVEAGCGSGKTAAAYLWASANANKKRLFFCYPTTGTASEGFSGYLRDPDFEAVLIHSRAEVDYRLLENMPSPSHEENDLREARLEALETWPIPAVVCTAHTVFGIMENVRRGLYAWPSLVQSVFVFDEIHAFSDRLFSYLLRFLETFRGTPILLMTATLPHSRKEALNKVCKKRGGLTSIKGPQEREKAPRYRLSKATTDEAWLRTKKIIFEGGKVLWICNTVKHLFNIHDEAVKNRLPVQPYHSRYRYKDRLKRQRTVIDGFKTGKTPMLAVTTQVAEMSLDLSADLLVTQWAPIPSLIQRMGRLNRFEEIPETLKDALFIKPDNWYPYASRNSDEGKDLNATVNRWLDNLIAKEKVSQKDLMEEFALIRESEEQIITPILNCQWLDSLWKSEKSKSSLEEAGYTVEIIMEEDLNNGCPDENVIPMPFPPGDEWKEWPRTGRYLIAPAKTIQYDELKGALWKN